MVAVAKKMPASAASAARSEFACDVLAGLTAMPKQIPPKYFYDAQGSRLFERITGAREYYPTRCEMQALRDHAAEIGALIREGSALVEFGSGSSKKARILLHAAPKLACYVPVDICVEMLEREAIALRRDQRHLTVLPIVADFAFPFDLPHQAVDAPARAGFFPGSTIGNFEPYEAATFLRNAATVLGAGATMIVGVDLIKDAAILNAAYNDSGGVTEQFNLNLLTRMNRELDANFQLNAFAHHAFYNQERKRVEMHLASLKRQTVRVAGETVEFRAGETIHTENSYKYSIESFGSLARGAGWTPVKAWTDPKQYFSIQAFRLTEAKPAVHTALD